MRRQRVWRAAVRVGILIALAPLLTIWALASGEDAGAQTQQPPIASTLVATQELSVLPPARHWVVRDEHQMNAEHSHAGGFVFQTAGASVIRMENEEFPLREEQGIWVYESVPHTHMADGSSKLWTFTLETSEQVRSAPALVASKELTPAQVGPHLARLLSDQYQPGASTAPHRHFGPEVVYIREGSYELNYAGTPQNYVPGQGYTVEPLVPHRLRNSGQSVARLIGLSLVPLSKAPAETLSPDQLR